MTGVRNILVVGQVPPPWHGQAIAIQELVSSDFKSIAIHFVRMDFSRGIDDVGKFRWKKLAILPALIANIWRTRYRDRCTVLYYPPGATTLTGVARDAIVLLATRFLFQKVVFHSHAGGFMEVAEATPWTVRTAARRAYAKPDLLIQLTRTSPPDGILTKARRSVYVPYGIPDNGAKYVGRFHGRSSNQRVGLLFVGAVSPGKGIWILLQAAAELKARGIHFELQIVGKFSSAEFECECRSFLHQFNLEANVKFLGVLVDDDKWNSYVTADIFCFPSFYKAENQPLVVLEAMQFALPVVATDWRGIPTMVDEGRTGFIVLIKDSAALADRILQLIENPDLRIDMGHRGRAAFLKQYTDAAWRPAMEKALNQV